MEELKFQNLVKALYQNGFWLKLKKEVFLEFPQGVETQTSFATAIGLNSLMTPLNFILFVPRWLQASRVCHLIG